ncbi:MAG: DsrE/DsrF/DrsH-like family protein [Bacteroidetes bacterium]|nr:DsrE/DsrF/DrsH-like family protein [Bacteroidota bacterium]
MSENRKVSIICSKGTLDMALPAFIMGNAARMSGIEVHIFFTFWGMDIIKKSTMNKLHVATVGNPAMGIPTMIGGLPGMENLATAMMKKQLQELDIPDIPEWLEMMSDAGAHLWACQLAADMFKLKKEDLDDHIEEIISAVDFFDKAEGGQIIFI